MKIKESGSASGQGSESGSISQRHGSAAQDPDPDPHKKLHGSGTLLRSTVWFLTSVNCYMFLHSGLLTHEMILNTAGSCKVSRQCGLSNVVAIYQK
jgi:hypothetical protein